MALALEMEDQRRDLLFLVLIVFLAAMYDSHCRHVNRPSAVSIQRKAVSFRPADATLSLLI